MDQRRRRMMASSLNLAARHCRRYREEGGVRLAPERSRRVAPGRPHLCPGTRRNPHRRDDAVPVSICFEHVGKAQRTIDLTGRRQGLGLKARWVSCITKVNERQDHLVASIEFSASSSLSGSQKRQDVRTKPTPS
jgi:hypothetical protein